MCYEEELGVVVGMQIALCLAEHQLGRREKLDAEPAQRLPPSCMVRASGDELRQIILGEHLIKHVCDCSCWSRLSLLPSAQQIQLNNEGWEE